MSCDTNVNILCFFFGWVIKCVRFGKSLRQQNKKKASQEQQQKKRENPSKRVKSMYTLFHLYGNVYCHYHYDFTIQFEIFTNYSLF